MVAFCVWWQSVSQGRRAAGEEEEEEEEEEDPWRRGVKSNYCQITVYSVTTVAVGLFCLGLLELERSLNRFSSAFLFTVENALRKESAMLSSHCANQS